MSSNFRDVSKLLGPSLAAELIAAGVTDLHSVGWTAAGVLSLGDDLSAPTVATILAVIAAHTANPADSYAASQVTAVGLDPAAYSQVWIPGSQSGAQPRAGRELLAADVTRPSTGILTAFQGHLVNICNKGGPLSNKQAWRNFMLLIDETSLSDDRWSVAFILWDEMIGNAIFGQNGTDADHWTTADFNAFRSLGQSYNIDLPLAS